MTTKGVRVILSSCPRVPQEDVDSSSLLVWVDLMSGKALDDAHLP